MSDNCKDPNIVPPKNTAAPLKKSGKNPQKSLPGTAQEPTPIEVTGGPIKASSTGGQQQTPAQAAGGDGGGDGGSSSAQSQWKQPKTEHGRINGEKITEQDPCGGGEKKSDEFKPRTIYPFNKVTQTESGHVMEVDDTPGSERVSFFHRSGSNYEYYPNGDVVRQDVRDSYFHVFRDNYVHLGGYSSVTIDKGLKILVNSDEEENSKEKNVNFDIHIQGNANVNIYIEKGNMNVSLGEGDANMRINKGDVNILQDEGNYNHTIGGDYNLEVAGHMHVVVGGNVIKEIGGNRDERIDGEFDQTYLTNSGGYKAEYLQGDKRVYVGRNQIIQVANTSDEYAKLKTENYSNSHVIDVSGYLGIRSSGNLEISSGAELTVESTSNMTIKSIAGMDIFSSQDGTSPMRIYSATNFEFVAENYGQIRSAYDKIEIKAPQDIKLITQILYTPNNGDVSPAFSGQNKPINDKNPISNQYNSAKTTDSYLLNNKKQWSPTNSKK